MCIGYMVRGYEDTYSALVIPRFGIVTVWSNMSLVDISEPQNVLVPITKRQMRYDSSTAHLTNHLTGHMPKWVSLTLAWVPPINTALPPSTFLFFFLSFLILVHGFYTYQ